MRGGREDQRRAAQVVDDAVHDRAHLVVGVGDARLLGGVGRERVEARQRREQHDQRDRDADEQLDEREARPRVVGCRSEVGISALDGVGEQGGLADAAGAAAGPRRRRRARGAGRRGGCRTATRARCRRRWGRRSAAPPALTAAVSWLRIAGVPTALQTCLQQAAAEATRDAEHVDARRRAPASASRAPACASRRPAQNVASPSPAPSVGSSIEQAKTLTVYVDVAARHRERRARRPRQRRGAVGGRQRRRAASRARRSYVMSV